MRCTFSFPATVLALALAANCGRNESTDPATPARVSLHPAESAEAAGVTVQMIRVDNDSRCAMGVTCVWAGNAAVVITVRTPGNPPTSLAQLTVNTNLEPHAIDVSGYRVRLDSLTPYPVAGHPIDPNDYVGFFTISRVGAN